MSIGCSSSCCTAPFQRYTERHGARMFTQAARFLPTSTSASFSAAARSGRLVSTKSLVDSMEPILAMHKVTVQPANLDFHVEAGETVLAAALRQGVMLPYGC